MRRITLTVVITAAILVLLFSYRTSRNQSVTAATLSVASAHVVSGGATSTVSSASGPDPATNQITIASASPPSSGSSSSSPSDSSSTSARSTTSTAPPPTSSTSSSTATTATSAPSTASTTTKVDGSAASTRYGDVQVEVTITGGKITDVEAIEYPGQDPRDQEINADALPQLQAQVLAAQSANIAGVSGATFTTEGYITSLQSALDAANFK